MSPRKKKFVCPEATDGVQARTLIWEGVGFFFRTRPLAMWPIFLVLVGSNGTAWYKAITDDTVSIKPVGAVESSIMPQAVAADKTFAADTSWHIAKWKGENILRVRTPSGAEYDVEFPALGKLK